MNETRGMFPPEINKAKVTELLRAKTPTWQIDRWLLKEYNLTWREAMKIRREIQEETKP